MDWQEWIEVRSAAVDAYAFLMVDPCSWIRSSKSIIGSGAIGFELTGKRW